MRLLQVARVPRMALAIEGHLSGLLLPPLFHAWNRGGAWLGVSELGWVEARNRAGSVALAFFSDAVVLTVHVFATWCSDCGKSGLCLCASIPHFLAHHFHSRHIPVGWWVNVMPRIRCGALGSAPLRLLCGTENG